MVCSISNPPLQSSPYPNPEGQTHDGSYLQEPAANRSELFQKQGLCSMAQMSGSRFSWEPTNFVVDSLEAGPHAVVFQKISLGWVLGISFSWMASVQNDGRIAVKLYKGETNLTANPRMWICDHSNRVRTRVALGHFSVYLYILYINLCITTGPKKDNNTWNESQPCGFPREMHRVLKHPLSDSMPIEWLPVSSA